MEEVVAIEFLKSRDDKLVAKEVAIVSKNVIQTYHFKSLYTQYFYGDSANGLSWEVVFILYDQFFTVLSGSLSNVAHIYC